MAEGRPCPLCGAPIPPDAPSGGLCPKCLLKQGFSSLTPTRGAARDGRPSAPEPATLARLFPQLEILDLVGRGGMGAVYRARQKNLDRLVALKILTLEATRGPEFSERFAREARTLARLHHSNIVGLHDFGEVEGYHYFIMEYVDGASLREVLQSGKISPQQALAIIPRICDALQYAHEEGVVHRDIKPENILLDEKGRVKIADFGLAKLIQKQATDFTLTEPGQVMGTPAYMAPEQIEKPWEVDHRADIFSLGVVFYEMLTGELPLGRFAPPSEKVQVDVQLDEVVLRALEKEPRRRYQHASEVKTDVESIERGGPVAAAAEPVRETPPSPPSGGAGPGPAKGTAGTPAEGAAAEVHRPKGVTLIALYAFVNAILALVGVQFVTLGPLSGHVVENEPFLRVLLAGWSFVTCVGLLSLRRWGRISALVLAALGLFLVPAGTIFSIVILLYLLRADIRKIFEQGRGPAVLLLGEDHWVERVMNRLTELVDDLEERFRRRRSRRRGP